MTAKEQHVEGFNSMEKGGYLMCIISMKIRPFVIEVDSWDFALSLVKKGIYYLCYW